MSETSISAFAWTSVLNTPLPSAVLSPLTIGSNLLLSQANLTQARTFTFPDQSDVVTGITAAQTLTNKTADAGLNSFLQLYQSPLQMRNGGAEPMGMAVAGGAATGPVANGVYLDGMLGAHTTQVGPAAAPASVAYGWDNTYGLFTTLTSQASNNLSLGILTPITAGHLGVTRRAAQSAIRSVCKVGSTTNIRRYVGFTGTIPGTLIGFPQSDTPLATGDQGVVVGYRSSDSSWQVFYNDGSGTMQVQPVTPTINTDTNFHTVVIQ